MEGRTEGLDPREENEILGGEHFRRTGELIRGTREMIAEIKVRLHDLSEMLAQYEAEQLEDESREELEAEIKNLESSAANLTNILAKNLAHRKSQARNFLETIEVEGKKPN